VLPMGYAFCGRGRTAPTTAFELEWIVSALEGGGEARVIYFTPDDAEAGQRWLAEIGATS
jgi:hypothetical protein